jgi:hypothetical protein
MGIYLLPIGFSLAGSAVMLVITAQVARGSPRVPGYVCLVPAAFLFFGFCLLQASVAFPTLSLNALLVMLAGFVCAGLKTSVKSFVVWAVAVTALSYSVGSGISFLTWRELQELRDRYPYESLTDRLAYEVRPSEARAVVQLNAGTSADGGKHENVTLRRIDPDEMLGRWDLSDRFRGPALERLHEHFVEEFIASPGFGIARRFDRPTKYIIEIRQIAPIPLPEPDVRELSASAETSEIVHLPQAGTENAGHPAAEKLEEMHAFSVIDFVNARGFGFVRDRDHVAGFQEHQFREMPTVTCDNRERSRWQITRLELVSLLKYDEPAVYVSEHLPRMDELRDAPTRSLNTFEKSALADLQRGEDLRIHPSGDGIWMLGSIRARKTCIECHWVSRGDLLGAFSYKLRCDAAKAGPPS